MDTTLATRLKFFMDHKGYSSSIFADMCGIPRPSLSQLLTGRNKKVNDVLINLIHKANPELSIMWLMFGEGEMLNSEEKNSENFRDSEVEDSIFETEQTNKPENSILNGLTFANSNSNHAENKEDSFNLQIQSLQEQIENLRKNPRKVTQITIYYDDSTFETFNPVRK